ncbi:MAG: protease pro-enzyme activation domain-containing protein [Limisphaerales bacterium]
MPALIEQRKRLPEINVVRSFALWVFIAIFSFSSVQAGERRALRGHVPLATARSQPLGPLPQTNSLHLAISLPFRNRESLTNLLQRLYDPASPAFHKFLNPQQFTAAFGPTEKDYQRVIDFARSGGLTIIATSTNRALLEVRGSVSNIEKTFHVNMHLFRHPTEHRAFYGPDAEPSVDSDVPILFVAGLSSYFVPHPASLHVTRRTRAQNPMPNAGSEGGYYVGQDFRSAYALGVTNTGAGQSIGLVEFDSYYPTDVTNYLNLPAAGLGKTSVIISNLPLDLTGSPGNGNVEVALDIDMAISMAPGLSTIYVYEGTNDAAAPDIVMSRIVSDNLSRQISCSWTGFDDSAIDQDFQQFATQGQSFFQASGDSGAYLPGYNPVSPPSDNPYVTVVGGTTLYTAGPAGSWVSETTWNWFTQPFDGLSNNATSGGTSPTWGLPAWQKGINMSANQGSTNSRNLPDVALVANDLFLFGDDGYELAAGGTSAAAPLWAGLTALINQQKAAQAQPPGGFMNPALYAIGQGSAYASCFHDTAVGNNTNYGLYLAEIGSNIFIQTYYNSSQFFAVAGYDLCTGWGTPIGAGLINTLCPEPLRITPSTGFVSSGPYGGPFNVSSQNILLTNIATASFNWGLATTSPWLSAAPSRGTLFAGGAAASVTVALNATVSHQTVGAYTNTLWLTNLNDGVTQSQQYGLSVYPAPLTVTAGSVTRPFGQPNPAFQGTIVGLQNGDNIIALYNCSATASSQVGTYPIVPALNDPSDLETNYTVSLVSGSLTVIQATVAVTWAAPAPITYGTALSATQLNATANVPGNFAYNPPIGTVLNEGTNTLSVTFTPNDTVDYATATATVALVVTPLVNTPDTGGDTPLFPFWSMAGLLAGLAALGVRYLPRRNNHCHP